MACAEICPDFALEVWKFEVPVAARPSTKPRRRTRRTDMAPRLMQGAMPWPTPPSWPGAGSSPATRCCPSPSCLENMAKKLPAAGGVCINAESEIEAINMALGAAATGARAATGSCGQGISLMQEGIAELARSTSCPSSSSTWPGASRTTSSAPAGGGWGDYRTITLAAQGHPRGGGKHPGALPPGRPVPHPGHPLRRLRHRPHLGRHRGAKRWEFGPLPSRRTGRSTAP